MKYLILFLFANLILFSQLSANVYYGKEASQLVKGAEEVRYKDFSDIPSYVKFKTGSEINFTDIEKWVNGFFKSDYNFGIVFIKKESDKLGMEHYRYQQTYNNIPIDLTTYIFHIKDGKVISANGNLLDRFSSKQVVLSESQALEKAKEYIGAEVYKWELAGEEAHLKIEQRNPNASYFPQGELVYIAEEGNIYKETMHLAYKFNIYAHKPISRSFVYVDASSGAIVFENKIIKTADVLGSAQTVYSGTQNITTDSYSGSYRLRETGRGNGIETYDMNVSTNYGNAVDFTDTDNIWDNVNAEKDQYATDAHWGAEMTYDYFYNLHGRNSIDGAGFALLSYVHFDLIGYGYPSNVNAFWDGTRMTYGDGNDSTITPLTALDICGHEITHGLTSFTADLVYSYESGAMNEAFSDIFGNSIEFYAKPLQANWTMGEDIGVTLRSMSDPNLYGDPDTYLGDYWATGSGDNGGVHTNSGVLNFWYYLLCEGGTGTNDNGDIYNVTGLGVNVAGAIAFRTLTVYLNSSSQYFDARYYGILSAIDLYGACSPEVESVTNAFYAVGIGNAYTPNVTSDFIANMTESCAAPFTVQFTNMSVNGTSFIWDFGDGQTSTAISPSHTYNSTGTYDVELFSDGGTCGSDTTLKAAYIFIDPSVNCVSLMPTSGTYTHYSCQGTLYDNGGPTGNYTDDTDVSFTITTVGADSIKLIINSFDIEAGSSGCNYDYVAFYDGPTTASPLINSTQYCNTNGSPGVITSTGESITVFHHADQAVSGTGFEIDWTCYYPTVAPVANFITSTTETCTGVVNFTDLSSNGPNGWDWDFGDGITSSLQNPTHTYTQNGTYTVILTATNPYGSDVITMSNLIIVNIPDAPVAIAVNDTICENETATINATASGIINWYNNSVGGTLINTGTSFTTPALTSSTTYWLQNVEQQAIQNVGEINNTADGGQHNGSFYNVFDAYVPFVIKSVEINAATAGNVSIDLINSGGTLQSVTVAAPAGVSRINLDINVPVGTEMGLQLTSTGNLWRNNANCNYPYVIPGVVSINYSTATTNPTGYYYYFYDWEIQEPDCISARDSVNIIVETCIGINDIAENNYQIYPNPTNNMLFVELTTIAGKTEVQLFDIDGKLIRTVINSKQISFDMSDLAGGVYFCKIITESNFYTERIVLIK